ncbi:MAG: hypothetical protein R3B97_01410 [Dehalococcoidia bacterium]|nr:hypothetical protein [Dehalococcoidia bacterium]MCB9486230.1 hypothetical protein [Thermoflexaceae bacterium]
MTLVIRELRPEAWRELRDAFTGESEPLRDLSPLRSLKMIRPLASGAH